MDEEKKQKIWEDSKKKDQLPQGQMYRGGLLNKLVIIEETKYHIVERMDYVFFRKPGMKSKKTGRIRQMWRMPKKSFLQTFTLIGEN